MNFAIFTDPKLLIGNNIPGVSGILIPNEGFKANYEIAIAITHSGGKFALIGLPTESEIAASLVDSIRKLLRSGKSAVEISEITGLLLIGIPWFSLSAARDYKRIN